MTHDIHKVERFEIVGPYTLALGFEDGTEQRIDFRPVLEGELFGPLKNRTLFDAVTLDKEVGTLTWPNGADFDPTTLHDWPQVRDELVEMARGWANITAGAQRTAQWPTWMPTTLGRCRQTTSPELVHSDASTRPHMAIRHPSFQARLGVADRVR